MPAYPYHVFVCANRRPPGHPKGSCAERGCNDLLMALTEAVDTNELWEAVKVNSTNCLGPCDNGPSIVVYPEGIWYGGVKPADVPELVASHFLTGVPVERLRLQTR